MPDAVESYKETILGPLINSGKEDLLLHTVKCWNAYAVDEKNWSIHTVLYCSGIMYKYYSCLGFLPIKNNEEENDINKEVFSSTPHFIKTVFISTVFRIVLLCTMIN